MTTLVGGNQSQDLPSFLLFSNPGFITISMHLERKLHGQHRCLYRNFFLKVNGDGYCNHQGPWSLFNRLLCWKTSAGCLATLNALAFPGQLSLPSDQSWWPKLYPLPSRPGTRELALSTCTIFKPIRYGALVMVEIIVLRTFMRQFLIMTSCCLWNQENHAYHTILLWILMYSARQKVLLVNIKIYFNESRGWDLGSGKGQSPESWSHDVWW